MLGRGAATPGGQAEKTCVREFTDVTLVYEDYIRYTRSQAEETYVTELTGL